jgi:hypothetical protein
MSDIERELESELHRALDPIAGEPVPDRRTMPSRATRTRALIGGAGAALTFKVLSGAVAAAAAVTVAGAATTGSFNPGDWGQAVTQAVTDCKNKLGDGAHGIGDCVSALASTHGQNVASAARQHGQGSGSGSSNAHGNNSNADGHTKDRQHPQPTPKGSLSEPTDSSSHPAPPLPTPHP